MADIHDIDWLQERHQWPALKSIVMIESTRELRDKIERETKFYIASLNIPASLIGTVIRDHWAVENSLHWVLDMVFRDDECRLRTDHAPANFTTLKHIALNLIRRAPGKDSIRLRRKGHLEKSGEQRCDRSATIRKNQADGDRANQSCADAGR